MTFDPGPLSTSRSYLEIDDGTLPAIRIPISSWQATLQSDRASYLQAVIPSALQWVDAITDRLATGEIIIYHAIRNHDGSEQEWEFARSPLGEFRLDRGPMRMTATVNGYVQPAGGGGAAPEGLVHYFPLDEAAGATVNDEVGTLVGAVGNDAGDSTIVTGATGFGNARNLDAVGNQEVGNRDTAYLDLWGGTSDPDYKLTAWTVVYRFRIPADAIMANNQPAFFLYQDGVGATFEDYFDLRGYAQSDKTVQRFELWAEGADGLFVDVNTNVAISPGPYMDGEWHQLAFTGDGTTIRVIYDGAQIISGTSNLRLVPKLPLRIGHGEDFGTAASRKGLFTVDDIGVFNRALTTGELSGLFGAPIVGAGGAAPSTHVLRNVRSVSISGGARLRCDLDPTVRPGDTVQGAGYEFVAAYINAYVTSSDRYMDVGERML